MEREHKNMEDIRNELRVQTVKWKIEKRVMERIGHVMRMDDTRTTKAATLGWLEGLEHIDKCPGKKRDTVLYWRRIVKEAGWDWTDIENLTSDRDK